MGKRKIISVKTRFEVFKRDKFTCQYCGQKAPDVILHLDHITPVSKGGDNSLINLVTSCRDCNLGKKDKLLSDNTTITIERKQIENDSERREQIRLMFEWKKSLESNNEYMIDNICDYYKHKMNHHWVFNENGRKIISEILKNTDVKLIIECIDITFDRYIRFDNEGCPTQKTVEDFLTNLRKIINVKKMPPIKQKLVKLRGIGRKTFKDWNDIDSIIKLDYYVKALKIHGYSEKNIIDDIEEELIPNLYNSNNYYHFIDLIENWTNQINKWIDEEGN